MAQKKIPPQRRRIAVYPGTFDPVTFGHLDIIQRSLKLFDHVIVAVTNNPEKHSFFPLEERVNLLRKTVPKTNKVKIELFAGLLVDFMRRRKSNIIIRGLRELSDFEFEFQQAIMNRKLSPEVDTVFILTDPRYFYVSSSMVRQISALQGDTRKLVPPPVQAALSRKMGTPQSTIQHGKTK